MIEYEQVVFGTIPSRNEVDTLSENTLFNDLLSSNPSAYRVGNSKLLIANDLEALWGAVQHRLSLEIDSQIYSAWLKPITLISIEPFSSGSIGDYLPNNRQFKALLSSPNKFSCDYVSGNYGEYLAKLLSENLGGAEIILSFTLLEGHKGGAGQSKEGAGIDPAALAGSASKESATKSKVRQSSIRSGSNMGSVSNVKDIVSSVVSKADTTNINTKYNFSNFVVGSCNQLAHAVSLQVSDDLGGKYNPLFIYGGVGLGKTHLANAIGNANRRRNKRALLVSSESFLSELISSLRNNSMTAFKSKFRSIDLLIIDDIQFIVGKERTQEEFFHTFNELYSHQKQIVITSDKLPHELVGIEERLQTRFSSGIAVDLQRPDFETRVAILTKKAIASHFDLPIKYAEMLAEKIDTNVRELEGALNRLIAFCQLRSCGVDDDLIGSVLRVVSPIRRREINPELVKKAVAEKFSVSVHDLVGKRRTHNVALARQVAMYLCRELTNCSYPELGAFFGGRDHSTVIHARKVVAQKIKTEDGFGSEIKAITANICSG